MQENINYKLQYKNWHDESEESKNRDIEIWKIFLKLHNLYPAHKNAKILELGCGMGRLMLTLKQAGFENIKGVDVDDSMVEAAKQEELDVEKKDAVQFLRENNELFDTIYCLDVVEHISKDEQIELFKLLNSHLKPDGFIAIRVPNALSPTSGLFRYEDFTHVTSYTPVTVRFLCQNGGLDYVLTRPEGEETIELQRLKAPYAEIYRQQFFIDDVILTPNIVSVVFKDKRMFEEYQESVQKINNEYKYNFEYVNLGQILRYYARQVLIKILPRGLTKRLREKGKYKIAVLKTK